MANKKKEQQRLESTKKYIDELSEKYSKLNIIRVDLGYKKPHSDEIGLAEANRDINHMMSNRRSKPSIFEHQVGYTIKREYTEDKGIHIHAVIIYDGQKVRNGAHKGDQISEYWEQITEKKGSAHNCNRNTYTRNGIGMLDHRDNEKRKILDEDVISYLTKDEQSVDSMKEKKRGRAFTRGSIPKNSKGNKGRPRGGK